MALTPDNKKQLFAGALVALLAVIVYFQFFAGDDKPSPAAARVTKISGTPAPSPTAPGPKPGSATVARGQIKEPAIITDPLPLELLVGRGRPEGGTGRNIFVYPTPTPTPPPKPTPTPIPPPPPPVLISGLNPSGVIARTADFNLTVLGAKIPPDSKVFINGRDYPTTFVNETQVRASVTAATIRASGNMRVEVKSVSDPSLFSNALNLNVAEPPVPPFLYVALSVDKKGVHTAVLKSQADGQLIYVHQGDTIDRWRILAISGDKIDILDTNYNIPHSLNFTGEGG